jgi:type VII secretion-associated serine protease mycosin
MDTHCMKQRMQPLLGNAIISTCLLAFLSALVLAAWPHSGGEVASRKTANIDRADYVPGEVILKLAGPGTITSHGGKLAASSPELTRILTSLPFTSASEILPGTYKLSAGADTNVLAAISVLRASAEVSSAEPNAVYHLMATSNDPYYTEGMQWGLGQIKVEQAWGITTGNNGIIAILDTGTATDHPDLAGKSVPGYDFVSNDAMPYDDVGHGTYTAGIAGAASNNREGIAGVSWGARLMPVKVLNAQGVGSDEMIARGIRWAVDNGARVINASFGGNLDTLLMRDAIKYAYDHNVLIVAAAGNTPDGKPKYPAAFDTVLAVGSTGRNDTYSGFSSWGAFVDVTAPGVDIVSTSWRAGMLEYASASGTSASCPFVSGVAQLVWSANPALTVEQVKRIIEDSSEDLGDTGFDEHYGYGRVNALRAVQTARQGPPPTRTSVASRPPTRTATPLPTQPASQGPSLQVDSKEVASGSLIAIAGAGFGSNEMVSLDMRLVDGTMRAIGSALADSKGAFRAEAALFNTTPPGKTVLTASGSKSGLKASVELLVVANLASLRPTAFDKVPLVDNTAAQVYFPPVGHTLKGAFLKFWQQNGGLAVFGYPLSEEFQEVSPTDGKSYLVQYFERNRFEYHPELAGMKDEVLMGLLGVEMTRGRVFPPAIPFTGDAIHTYFKETQHSLNGAFLKYWQEHGGLAIFGYPISEEITENGYKVQYFERNRFEYHPEYAGTKDEVLLGLLGVEVIKRNGWLEP